MADPGGEPEPMEVDEAKDEELGDSSEPVEKSEATVANDGGDDSEEEDKKPAAKDRNSGKSDDEEDQATAASHDDEEEDKGDGDSSSSDSSSDEEEEDKSKEYVTEDGRKLSEYEIQRLERIKRNREYLAQLGLEGKDGGGVLGKKKKMDRPKKKPTAVPLAVRRSPISRRSKVKKVTYTEPSASVRDLLRVADKKATNAPPDLNLPSPEKAALPVAPPKTPPEKKPKKPGINERQELFVHLEFKSIQSSKRTSLLQAERNVRAAEKEVKYWHKLIQRWERLNQRQVDAQRQKQTEVKERSILGGKSIKELLQDIDARMPEIQETIKEYDDCLQVRNKMDMTNGGVFVVPFLLSPVESNLLMYRPRHENRCWSSIAPRPSRR